MLMLGWDSECLKAVKAGDVHDAGVVAVCQGTEEIGGPSMISFIDVVKRESCAYGSFCILLDHCPLALAI
jgi:hypothetical protein